MRARPTRCVFAPRAGKRPRARAPASLAAAQFDSNPHARPPPPRTLHLGPRQFYRLILTGTKTWASWGACDKREKAQAKEWEHGSPAAARKDYDKKLKEKSKTYEAAEPPY